MAEYQAFPLTSLLPQSSFLLAYSIPLLLLSILLTFAGAYLTLDRTRSFAPRYDAIPGSYKRPRKFRFALEGGVGGLAIGYAFGVHLSTFFALLVPSISHSKPLTPKAFVAVWLLSSIVTTTLAGRWKYAALTFAGISGGTLFSLAVCIAIHPALLTRVVLTAIITPILTVVTLLPLPRFQHGALRWATAGTGAGGMVISIALLANIPAWSNAWERFWLKDGITWGTGKEKGLVAAFFLLFSAGIVCDMFLRRKLGECPDEKWDSYLANYSANLPDRPGMYKPPTTVWGRLFGTKKPPKDILFPDDHDSKLGRPSSPVKLGKHDPLAPGVDESYEFQSGPEFLRKGRSAVGFQAKNLGPSKGRKGRDAVRFRPLGDLEMLSSDSDSEDDLIKKPLRSPAGGRPWLKQKASIASSTPTLVGDQDGKTKFGVKADDIDYDKDIKKLQAHKAKGFGDGEVPEYSDYEDDISSVPPRKRGVKHGQSESTNTNTNSNTNWSPPFLKNPQRSSKAVSFSSQTTAVEGGKPPPGAVPATPSLIVALDRIALAQKDAFSSQSLPSGLPTVQEDDKISDGRWTDFWRDVNKKAKAGG